MGYVGNQQTEGYSQVPAKQDLTGATGTSLTLTHAVASAEGIDLYINNVRQEPTEAYSVVGTAVTLTGSVVASDDIYVVYNSLALQTTVPPDASVSTAKIIDGSVTAAKLAAGVQGVAGISSSSTSGTALSIDANNIVTMPSKPMFRVYGPSSNQNNQNFTTDSLVNYWDTESFDVGSNFASGRFTAPISGHYFFHISLQFRDLNTNNAFLKFRKNGSNNAGSFVEAETGSTINRINLAMTDIIQLDATEYVEAYLQAASDTSLDWIANESHFCGYLIG